MKKFSFSLMLLTMLMSATASAQQKDSEKSVHSIQMLCKELEKNIVRANVDLDDANKRWVEKQYGKNSSENPEVYEKARNARVETLVSLEGTWHRLGCVHLLRVK